MKSIIEQASSVGKAIQKAWERAEQPKEFTVKIFQDAQRGFLGFNATPAKVGIFFQEAQQSKKPYVKKSTSAKGDTVKKSPYMAPAKTSSEKTDAQKNTDRPRIAPKELETTARPWIAKAITLMKLENAPFTIKTQRNNLVITFTQPLFEDRLREKKLFTSLSLLTLVMLRNQLNSDLRDVKIIIKRK